MSVPFCHWYSRPQAKVTSPALQISRRADPQRTLRILPGCARPMVESTMQGGWKAMSMGYGSHMPASICTALQLLRTAARQQGMDSGRAGQAKQQAPGGVGNICRR